MASTFNESIHGIPSKSIIKVNKKKENLIASKEFNLWNIYLTSIENYTVECHTPLTIARSETLWAFELCKNFMQQFYESSSVGWDDNKKYKEMTANDSRFLIMRSQISRKPVAFSHFRFDMDYGEEVLYCYELHVGMEVQRLGIGTFLLKLLEHLAFVYKMKKVILTVFKSNSDAINFYKKCGYQLDRTSPEDSESEKFDYIILSKYVHKRKHR